MNAQKTYRQLIQEMIQHLQDVYDRAGDLRDFAAGSEKDAFNMVRDYTMKAWAPLQILDNHITDSRGKQVID